MKCSRTAAHRLAEATHLGRRGFQRRSRGRCSNRLVSKSNVWGAKATFGECVSWMVATKSNPDALEEAVVKVADDEGTGHYQHAGYRLREFSGQRNLIARGMREQRALH